MEAQNETSAIPYYEKTLAIDPHHQESMIHLSQLHLKQNQFTIAEKYLMNVLIHDPSSHEAW